MFVKLIDDLRARFVTRGFTEVTIDEGKEARNAQSNFGSGSANRIVFAPASEPMPITEPTQIGEDDTGRRQLWNVEFVFDVCFAAYDADHPERDLAHRHRCFDLLEVTMQEVQLAYWGVHKWTNARWSLEKKHITHGAELIATLTLNIPIFDIQWSTGTPSPVPGEPKPVT